MGAGDMRTARAALDLLVTREPTFAEAWNKRATLLYLIGDDDGSVADVRRTLALEPRHFGALSGLGLINARHERPEAGAAQLRGGTGDPSVPARRPGQRRGPARAAEGRPDLKAVSLVDPIAAHRIDRRSCAPAMRFAPSAARTILSKAVGQWLQNAGQPDHPRARIAE